MLDDFEASFVSDASFVSARSMEDPILKVGTQSRIPDFALFHTHPVKKSTARELILLVEIKPYTTKKVDAFHISSHFEKLPLQVVTQALFASEESDVTEIKVLCVVGWHWHVLAFRTGQSLKVPEGDLQKPPSEGYIMLPRMPQGKFHTDRLSAASDIEGGYTKLYLDALEAALAEARAELTSKFRCVFDFKDDRIVAYDSKFTTEWAVVVKKANASREES